MLGCRGGKWQRRTCLVHQLDKASPRPIRRLWVAAAVEQLLQVAAQVSSPHAEHEADGIHEVRLPGPIGADDRRELLEGADLLAAAIRFEIIDLEAQQPAGGARASRHGAETEPHGARDGTGWFYDLVSASCSPTMLSMLCVTIDHDLHGVHKAVAVISSLSQPIDNLNSIYPAHRARRLIVRQGELVV